MGKLSLPRKRTSRPQRKAKVEQKKIDAAIEAIDAIDPTTPEAAKLFVLLKSWLADDSGYDEETLPQLKNALNDERDRVRARRLFDD